MPDQVCASDTSPRATRGSCLVISYPKSRAVPPSGRRVVYIRYGDPVITDAEIEIMQLALDQAQSCTPPSAHNDD